MKNRNWFADELNLEASPDLYGEFYSSPMYNYAESFEWDIEGQREGYFEMEHATARRLNAAYEACTLIHTDLLEADFIEDLLRVMNRVADGRLDEGISLAKELAKKFYAEDDNG